MGHLVRNRARNSWFCSGESWTESECMLFTSYIQGTKQICLPVSRCLHSHGIIWGTVERYLTQTHFFLPRCRIPSVFLYLGREKRQSWVRGRRATCRNSSANSDCHSEIGHWLSDQHPLDCFGWKQFIFSSTVGLLPFLWAQLSVLFCKEKIQIHNTRELMI